jgi:hypothetical protein
MNSALAQFTGPPQGGIDGFLENLFYVLSGQVIPLLIAVATLVFMWGIIRYITAGGSEDKLVDARRLMIFGIVGLAVMVSVWGLVKFIVKTVGVEPVPIPDDVGRLQ